MSDGCTGPGAKPGSTCGREVLTSGLCASHYKQSRRCKDRGEAVVLTPLRRREEEPRDRILVRVVDATREALDAEAERRGVPVATIASEALDAWARRRR